MRHHALHLVAAAALGFGLAACSDTRDTESLAGPDTPGEMPDVGPNESPEAGDIAQTETDPGAPTAMDQSSADRDMQLTQMIRQKISDNEQLSTEAENVTVIADDGVVTLRGPVETEAEKQAIVDIARETEGVSRVDDQLEVASR
ncbi:MAG TPA: BON domain-containing protein [Myxococcota bacterium]|nr:BON domain-containing protein [Myxococcota bacterium]